MPRETCSAEEIVGILRDIEIMNGKGKSIADCCRDKGISEAINYRWKKEYSGLHPDQAKRLKELEKENNRLKKLLAEVMLDNQILKDINLGNFEARPSEKKPLRPSWRNTGSANGGHVR